MGVRHGGEASAGPEGGDIGANKTKVEDGAQELPIWVDAEGAEKAQEGEERRTLRSPGCLHTTVLRRAHRNSGVLQRGS